MRISIKARLRVFVLRGTLVSHTFFFLPFPSRPLAVSHSLTLLSPVGLRLLIDGYQPFKHTVSNMTPVFLEILNLPAHVRQQSPHQIPLALGPGPKDTASEMYFELLRPIVKELRQLYAGVNMPVYVPAAERIEERSVSAVLVVTSFDTPACRKVHSCWRVLRIALSQ